MSSRVNLFSETNESRDLSFNVDRDPSTRGLGRDDYEIIHGVGEEKC